MQLLQKHRVIAIPSFLFLVTLLSLIPFRSKVLYHWDSVQFALATEHYDITVHQPHPPGYFLYVMLGRLLNIFTHDANTSFVALSVVVSAATVVAVAPRNDNNVSLLLGLSIASEAKQSLISGTTAPQ
jgi:hypothetical protein